MMNDALEGAWSVFKTSLFHYGGVLGLIAANFLFPNVMPGSGFLIYGTSFFAFATLFPKIEFLMFFFLPVQVRFLAMIQAGLMLLAALGNWWLFPFFLIGCANYLIFSGIPALRGTAQVMQSAQRRKRFKSAKEPEAAAFHSCHVCKRTDVTDPQLEFRVGADGREYCVEHLPE
jgi:hypothetical protein